MSDGGVGDGLTFWATFKIEGGAGGLTVAELKSVTGKIKDILAGMSPVGGKPVVGKIVTAARLTDNVGDDGVSPALTVTYAKNK